MNVGIIGAGAPSMAGVMAHLATMAQSRNGGVGGFRFVYRNREDNEFYSKSYKEDKHTNRADFLDELKSKNFLYSEEEALKFLRGKESEQIFKELI